MSYLILFLVSIISICYFIFKKMISSVLFQPTTVKCDDTDYIESLNKTSTSYWVQAKNHQSLKSKERIHAVLLDSQKDLKIEKNLSQSDKFSGLIFLFSHGNAGNIQCNFQNELITFLRKYGSVFLYDYRGYGMSDTTQISEQSLIEDISSVWDFLIHEKHVDSNRIIVIGQSLGNVPSTGLIANLIRSNSELPKALLLDSPFHSIDYIAEHYFKIIGEIYWYLSVIIKFIYKLIQTIAPIYIMNNYQNLISIGNKIPICIFHSKFDEVIPYENSVKLSESGCKLMERNGLHCNNLKMTQEIIDYLDKLLI